MYPFQERIQTPETKKLFAETLDLAGRGWRVIPLHDVAARLCSCGKRDCGSPGKHPRTANGLKDGTVDTATIRRWWTRWPTANIGICTGAESGVWMLGPDGQAGIEALEILEREHAELPRTPQSKSGSGGRHYYFRWPVDGKIGNRKNHRGLSIDVRGTGGYFVAAPYRNKNGAYAWEIPPNACDLADAPAWLLGWVRGEGKTSGPAPTGEAVNTVSIVDRAIAYLAKMPPAISGQGRHDRTMEAARVVAGGFDLGAEAALQILAAHFNPHCQPPWTEKELRHKCQEADTVPFGKPRGWLLKDTSPRVKTGDRNRPPAGPKNPQPRTLPEYQAFPLAALPPLLRDYVDASAAAIGCDPALVALPALAVVAGCIGNTRAIKLRRDWREPAVIWAITILRSGGVKSAGWDAAVAPLREYQMDGWDEHQRKKKEAKANREEEPKPPPCYYTSDATIAAVGELLRDDPRGVLLARDELDGWFQGFTRFQNNGATDRPHWLEMHSARAFRLDRITRNRGPLAVRRACCSICGTIQPGLAELAEAKAGAWIPVRHGTSGGRPTYVFRLAALETSQNPGDLRFPAQTPRETVISANRARKVDHPFHKDKAQCFDAYLNASTPSTKPQQGQRSPDPTPRRPGRGEVPSCPRHGRAKVEQAGRRFETRPVRREGQGKRMRLPVAFPQPQCQPARRCRVGRAHDLEPQ